MQPIILPYRGILPRIAADAFVAPGAVIVGDVEIAAGASIWFVVGAGSNVQDGTVVHGSTGKPPTWIGAKVTIGHMALIHACRLEDGSFVGMKACVSDGAIVEGGAMVAAGALVTPGKRVPRGELWAGSPACFMRALGDTERGYVTELPDRYAGLAAAHRAG
jgi:gamma-carbonic anhydrase